MYILAVSADRHTTQSAMKNLNLLKPTKLDVDPNSPTASKEWKHWRCSFTNFLEECGENAPDKLRSLVNCVSYSVYEHIEECNDFESAMDKLDKLYVRVPNELHSRNVLLNRKQHVDESLEDYLQDLKKLSKDCNLKVLSSAEQYRQELVRDAFINGVDSPLIRQRLLESNVLDLDSIYNQAHVLDVTQRHVNDCISETSTSLQISA